MVIGSASDMWFGRRIDTYVHLHDASCDPSSPVVEQAVRLARLHGIQRMVLVNNPTLSSQSLDPSPELIVRINSYTLGVVAQHPDVFIGLCRLNPANPVTFLEDEMDRCIAKGGMRGIKLHNSVNAIDSRLGPLVTGAQSLGVPVLFHNCYKQTKYVYHESTPSDIANLARRFPQATIIMSHLGGGRERGVLDIADLRNVAVNTFGSQPQAGLLEYAMQHLGAERIVYGSDYDVGRDFGVQIGRILGADISDEAKDLIFYANAARMLGLLDGC